MQNKNTTNQSIYHQPVLLHSVLELTRPQQGDTYLDLTAGYGGHAEKVIEAIGGEAQATLVDRDPYAIEFLQSKFGLAKVIHSDFLSALDSIESVDLVLVDLGVSSPQFDNANRGFSFKEEAPLDMRMDPGQSLTAAEIVNSYSKEDLADLIYAYGEEHRSRQIATAIIESRPITTTKHLADIVARSSRGKSRIHPATLTFQALRIAVNDELNQLKSALPQIEQVLNPGGRVAIISFHSLEDRIVKNYFRDSDYLEPINKKVVQGRVEDVSNPRARSAKLRVAVKNKNKKEV
ncbi:MAG: 16S rRNA (cytosine(1402)-N(4))-methyltransferase RsmH [Candidatus Saccharimonadales bacterium]